METVRGVLESKHILHSYSNMHCTKNLCQYNSNTLRPYELAMILCQYNSNTLRPHELAMIEVAVLSLSNPVFMASEISMHDVY